MKQTTMRAMRLASPGNALELCELPVPRAGKGQVLLRVEACGVCRTDLHLIDGELPDPVLFAYLTGRDTPTDPAQSHVIGKIATTT